MGDWERRSGLYDSYGDDYVDYHQDIKTELVAGATQSIVSLAEAKNYMKMSSDTSDDDFVSSLIKGITGVIEEELGGLTIYTQSWKQYQKGGCDVITLQKEPVIGNPTVSYYSSFSTTTATNITVTTHYRKLQNDLHHADGYWTPGRDGDGYVIEYEAGIFTASSYTSSNDPRLQTFKTAICRTIAYMYENREEGVDSIKEDNSQIQYTKNMLPEGVRRLLMPYNTGRNLI